MIAGFPTPGSLHVSTLTNLSWIPTANTIVYHVYFGTDLTPDETEFMGTVSTNSFELSTLKPFTTYFWRIDASDGIATIPGLVFFFTTGAEAVFDLNVQEVSYDTSVPLPIDEDILVHTVVTNNGELHTASLRMSFYASTDNIITEDDQLVDFDIITEDIPGFGSYEEDRLIYIPEDLRGQDLYIGVIVTGTGDADEVNLRNNVLSGSSPLNTTAVVYDLVAVECTYDIFTMYNQGDSVAIEFIVSNTGDFFSSFLMDFYISQDAIITPSDIYIGSSDTNFATAGGVSDWFAWMPLPEVMTTGDWYIGYIVSDDGIVDATPEDNWVSGISPIFVSGTTCDADLTGEGQLDFFDISTFLTEFASGCP